MNDGRERSGPVRPAGPVESLKQSARLESRLARVRPAALSPALFDRIVGQLSQVESPGRGGGRFADRPLLCAIGAGLVAACTIVTLLAADLTRPPPGGMASVAGPLAANRPPRLGDYPQVVARADDAGWDK